MMMGARLGGGASGVTTTSPIGTGARLISASQAAGYAAPVSRWKPLPSSDGVSAPAPVETYEQAPAGLTALSSNMMLTRASTMAAPASKAPIATYAAIGVGALLLVGVAVWALK